VSHGTPAGVDGTGERTGFETRHRLGKNRVSLLTIWPAGKRMQVYPEELG
jgi:hypothetical protein